MKTKLMHIVLGLALGISSATLAANAASIDKQMLNDAYVYLIGRAVVIRQEQQDITPDGIHFNQIKYNPVGKALEWVNPNLDVANNEAWIAVDAQTPALLEIPKIEDRYYTAQIIDEWGEVITNINRRNYPSHPHGKYVFIARARPPKFPPMLCASNSARPRPKCSPVSS